MTVGLHSLAGYLYRWRLYTSALFTVVFVVVLQVGDRHNDALSWIAFGVAVLLLWVPIAIHWAVAVRDSGRAFRAGLSDD